MSHPKQRGARRAPVRAMAVAFATLMLASTLPVSSATHLPDVVADLEVPVLPRLRPTQNCAPIGIQEDVLARMNHALAGNPAFYKNDVGVPQVCLNGPISEWQAFILQADALLDHVRNASREIQRQVDYRLETTLPDSRYPNELVEPRTVLLNETFNGHRTGGFGEWTVVTKDGEPAAWQRTSTATVNGTVHGFRFGHEDGYVQGTRQFLVSPEIDMTALKGNYTAVQSLVYLREFARDYLRILCNQQGINGNTGPYGGEQAPLRNACGESTSFLEGAPVEAHLLVEAYEAAFEDVIDDLPVMQHGAFLDLAYRFNMAPGEDAVRLWIYVGDRQPDRSILFNDTFGRGSVWDTCPHRPAGEIGLDRSIYEPQNQSLNNAPFYPEIACTPIQRGGYVVPGDDPTSNDDEHLKDVGPAKVFADDPPTNNWGFTGDSVELRTARVNMTRWLNDRVWIVFEAVTHRDERGFDIFNDTSRFPRLKDYGFELNYVYVEGDGYHRNFRVKDVAVTYPHQLATNTFGDAPTTRTTTPPGNDPVVAWVHNAGDYIENGTLRLNLSAKNGTATSGSWQALGSNTTRVSLQPDEVRAVAFPWGRLLTNAHPTLREGWIYQVTATLIEETNTTTIGAVVSGPTNSTLDPNTTAVRPVNAAALPDTVAGTADPGNLTAKSLVRAASLRNVTLLRADGLAGNPVQLCKTVDGRKCDQLPAGPKGDPREILVGVRNDGNARQNISVTLKVELEGVEKPDTIVNGPIRTAYDVDPGETRALRWTVVATQPGSYRIVAIPSAEVPSGATPPLLSNAERLMYVQRSTGIICLDTLVERECGEGFTGEIVPELRLENITATHVLPNGSIVVATEIREAHEGRHSGQLALYDPATDAWHILLNLSATRLNASFNAPPTEGYAYGPIRAIEHSPATGAYFLLGDNSTALRLNASGTLTRLGIAPSFDGEVVHARAAAWHGEDLLLVGDSNHRTLVAPSAVKFNSTLARFVNETFEQLNVTYVKRHANNTEQTIRYEGFLHDLISAPGGDLVLAGDGLILRRPDGTAYNATWPTVAIGQTARDLIVHKGRLVGAGVESFFRSAVNDTSKLEPLQLPPRVPEDFPVMLTDLAVSPDGRLFVLNAFGQVATCEDCYGSVPTWHYLSPVIPTVVSTGPMYQPRATGLVTTPNATHLVGGAGLFLTLGQDGLYDNSNDWSVVPALAPHDGGVIQSRRLHNPAGNANPWTSYKQSILLVPSDADRPNAQSSSSFRLFLNHSMNWTGSAPSTDGDDSFVEIRLLYRPVPSAPIAAASNPLVGPASGTTTCPPRGEQDERTRVLEPACHHGEVRHTVHRVDDETGDGWQYLQFVDLPASVLASSTANASPVGAAFYALEVYATDKIRYAIDDIRLQGRVGTTWKDVVAWYGVNSGKNRGDVFLQTLYNVTTQLAGKEPPQTVGPTNTPVRTPLVQHIGMDETNRQWELWHGPPFDLAVTSPWHLTTQYADRPVFAANSEFYKPPLADPASPRLFSDWDARLVSPVIDLTHAYDPVIEWRQTYAFRTVIETASPTDIVRPGDGGYVEIQYLKRGSECGVQDASVTCGWSPWYPVIPEGGYPRKEDLRFGSLKLEAASMDHPSTPGRIGQINDISLSYWGRKAVPDESGRITSPRLTETYETQRISLHKSICNGAQLLELKENKDLRRDCLPVNVTGTQVRVAFHLVTAGDWIHDPVHVAPHLNNSVTASFPGEGWYITDFKVLGAAKLGIDLAAQNLTFRVGYDVETIGVGPGTRVPVNVTIVNNGAFDVLGYTGRLEVHRVLDAALKKTTLVDTIHLAQQPVLAENSWVNHTLFWSVPSQENAQYSLRFVVEPIGIDRDEDHLDNVVLLGSTAAPIRAQTVRAFNTEFLISPENATSDITRYIPMFINNTGNVPLDGFTVERRIVATGRPVGTDAATCTEWRERLQRGQPTAIADCRVWTTQRAAAPGALSPLALLSDELNPTADLFWKAPERATYDVTLAARTQVGTTELAHASKKGLVSFATYLFDDVEGGLRGEARTGSWSMGQGWDAAQPGFRSTDAYRFGDATLDRYLPEADSSFTTPLVDLGSARTALLAFYHNYAFEPGFDGGLIEASDDGGKTWKALTPLAHPLTSVSYNTTFPVQASSPIHVNGDPESKAFAFTHDSTALPLHTDGWVLSQVDLTNYANITEPDVEYASYRPAELARFSQPPPYAASAPNVYYAADWCKAALSAGGCWTYENLTQGDITAIPSTGGKSNTIWWSGSGSRSDDGMRTVMNHMIEFEIDLSSIAPDQTVIADWWEYSDKFYTTSNFHDTSSPTSRVKPGSKLYTFQTFGSGLSVPDTYRYNLHEAKVVETRGSWMHMRSDLTKLIPRLDADGTRILKVGFAYTPVTDYSDWLDDLQYTPANESIDVISNSTNDHKTEFSVPSEHGRGFAIDGFKVQAFRSSGGAVQTAVTLIDEAQAWEKITSGVGGGLYECGTGNRNNALPYTSAEFPWRNKENDAPGCFHKFDEFIRNPPLDIMKQEGRIWSTVTAVPGVDSTWRVVGVKDARGFSPTQPRPTGDLPKAWYTGDIACRDLPEAEILTNEHFCAYPGSEARLITPAFDLSTIAGDSAKLSFWHRFAFHARPSGDIPLASGGVVEISVLDPATGKWGDWNQIYSSKDMTAGKSPTPKRDGSRGGYTGFTTNASPTSDSVRRYNVEFDSVLAPDRGIRLQYLYTGNSLTLEQQGRASGAIDGWLQETFDVSQYLNRKVRFAFHYQYSQDIIGNQMTTRFTDPDTVGQGERTGWWITDVALVGDVLVGKPVQLRFRAGTDGNVHDGRWLLDDIGLFGARYGTNVGIFVDQTPRAFGSYNNSVTTVPVTIRNLGDSVRRDLALEVRIVGEGLTVHGVGPDGNQTLEGGALVLKGFTLGPGQSATAHVKVHTPSAFGSATHATLVLQLREANPQSATTPFAAITNNDVQGLLTREVKFELQSVRSFVVDSAAIRQVQPVLGEPVEYTLQGRNHPGFGPLHMNFTCKARTVTGYDRVDHRDAHAETPKIAAEYPCAISGKTSLARKEWTNLTFTATPTVPGFLQFIVTYNITGQGDLNYTVPPAGVPVGVPVTTYAQSFGRALDVTTNFSAGSSMQIGWSASRGHTSLGSLYIGANESIPNSDYRDANACGGVVECFARTTPVDLHNYSASTPAFLSFWHMDRFARYDGAQVRLQTLIDETRPGTEGSWSDECIITPINGYEGPVRHRPTIPGDGATTPPTPGDLSSAFAQPPYSLWTNLTPGQWFTSPDHFFISRGGVWEETWSLATFRLGTTCTSVKDGSKQIPVLGRTVRFKFALYPGTNDGSGVRGPGHAWLIDDITVGPLALNVRPTFGQSAGILDNTTKAFHVVVENLGSMPDIVRLHYDAQTSSTPDDAVRVPDEAYVLQPGEKRTVRVEVTLPRDPSLLPAEFTSRLHARSILDPNAGGSTQIDLSFAPRQWAEMSLFVEAPRGLVQEATETFIPITIENNGLVDSVPSKLRIVDEWEGGRIVHTLDVPSIPSYSQSAADASRVLEFRWRPERGSIGPHTLTFEVDPDALGEEYTRTNNIARIVVPVIDLLIPDLHIAELGALSMRNSVGGGVSPARDADVARFEVAAGEVVSLQLKVANKGRAGATNVDVRAFIGALSLPPKTIPYIAPGTEAVVTFHWLAQKGEHEIEFLVRSEQVELTTTNNRYPGVGVTILTVKGYEVTVTIPPVDGILAPESEVRVPFRIENTGNAGEDLVLRASAPAGMRIMLPREGFFLRAGETYEDTARLILDAEAVAGEQFISIDAVARENPMKVASGRAAVSVLASYGGSIAGGYALSAPPELEIPVVLVNEGNSLEPWKLILDLPPGWTAREPMPAKVVVPAHDRVRYTFHVTVPLGTAPGERVLAVKAEMPNGEKREGVARAMVQPLRAAAVTLAEGAPKPDRGALAIPIHVQNTGNVREPFSVLLVDPPAGVEMRVEPAEFLLPPGGEAIATLIVKPNATVGEGTYPISGYTRFEGVVPQTREGLANVQMLRVPIVRQDVKVSALEFTPRAQIDAGDRVSVKVAVQNLGQYELTQVPVHLFVDDVFAGEAILPSIAPGGRVEATFNWTAVTGVHTLTAVVDPYEDTVDGDRADNAVSALATVGVDVAPGGVAAGRADAPLGGAAFVVLALLGALVVTRISGSWRRERR